MYESLLGSFYAVEKNVSRGHDLPKLSVTSTYFSVATNYLFVGTIY